MYNYFTNQQYLFHCRCLAALCIGCTFELTLATFRVLCGYTQLDLQNRAVRSQTTGLPRTLGISRTYTTDISALVGTLEKCCTPIKHSELACFYLKVAVSKSCTLKCHILFSDQFPIIRMAPSSSTMTYRDTGKSHVCGV